MVMLFKVNGSKHQWGLGISVGDRRRGLKEDKLFSNVEKKKGGQSDT